jgi:hypothetical protein
MKISCWYSDSNVLDCRSLSQVLTRRSNCRLSSARRWFSTYRWLDHNPGSRSVSAGSADTLLANTSKE